MATKKPKPYVGSGLGPKPGGTGGTSAAALAAAGAGGSSGVNMPLGVSKGPKGHWPHTRGEQSLDSKHQAPTPFGQHAPTTQIKQVPLYYGSDADAPGGWSPEYRDQLLQTMVQVGLLNPKQYHQGVWDTNAKRAFEELLGEANRQRASWGDVLDQRVALAQQEPPQRTIPPLTITHTNPTDIKAAAQQSAAQLLGRKLHDDELSPFVAGYQSQETLNQTQAYNQQYDTASGQGYGQGGTSIDPHPNVGAFADQQINDKYKTEVQGNQIGQNALAFMKLLGSGAPQAGLPGVQT